MSRGAIVRGKQIRVDAACMTVTYTLMPCVPLVPADDPVLNLFPQKNDASSS